MTTILEQNDLDMCANICWSFAHLTNSQAQEAIEYLMNDRLLARIIELLRHPDKNLKIAAIRTVGNILSSKSAHTIVRYLSVV